MKKYLLFLIPMLQILFSNAQSIEAGISYSGATDIPFYNSYGAHLSMNHNIGKRFVVHITGSFTYANQYYVESFLPDTFMFGVPDPSAYRWVTTKTQMISVSSSVSYKLVSKEKFNLLIGPQLSWNYLHGTQHYEIYSETYSTPKYYKLGAGLDLKFSYDKIFFDKLGLYTSLSTWYLFNNNPLGDGFYDPFYTSVGYVRFGMGVSYKM